MVVYQLVSTTSIQRIGTANFRGSELPRIIVSDDNADDKNEHLCIIGNDEEEFDDEYTDMMMFDLEL